MMHQDTNFSSGGGGGGGGGWCSGPFDIKIALTMVFFFSPQIIKQKSNGYFQRKLSFSKVPEGSNIYQEGVQIFPEGGGGVSNC